MKTIIVFNAPPNSGKDVSCEYLVKNYGAYHTYFKKRLYEVAAMVAGINLEDMIKLATDRIQKEKHQSCFVLNETQLSPRQWLIHVSENIVKPLLGKEYFGECLSREVRSITNELIVISDGGFQEELLALQTDYEYDYDSPYSREEIVYIRVVQLTRQGCSFNNDSRKYMDADWLDKNHMSVSVISNDGTLEDLYSQLDSVMYTAGYHKGE